MTMTLVHTLILYYIITYISQVVHRPSPHNNSNEGLLVQATVVVAMGANICGVICSLIKVQLILKPLATVLVAALAAAAAAIATTTTVTAAAVTGQIQAK